MHKHATAKPPITQKVANFFGAFGYLFLVMEWMWAGVIVAYPLITTGKLEWLVPAHSTPTTSTPIMEIDPTLGMIIGVVVTILCIALTVYALYTLPQSVAKTGSRAAHNVAKAIVPAVIHKPIHKKRIKLLTFQVVNALKGVAIAVPAVACLVTPEFSALSKDISLIIVCSLAALALINFTVQITIAHATKLDLAKIW